MVTPHQLTRDQARRIAVRAQLLDAVRPGDVVEVAEQLGAIKIDPTAMIAPAEHTILWSRIGYAYDPVQLTKAVERDRLLFEFDGAFRPIGPAALMLPAMRRWPRRESTKQWLEANDRFRTDVLARLRADGPLLAGRDRRHGAGEPPAGRLVGCQPGADDARLLVKAGRRRHRRPRGSPPPLGSRRAGLPRWTARVRRSTRRRRCWMSGASRRRASPSRDPRGRRSVEAGEPAVIEGMHAEVPRRPGGGRGARAGRRGPRRLPQPL